MKLMVITAISEFQSEVKKMLKEAQVFAYTYKNVVGFKDSTLETISANWFATEMNENDSVLFFAFVAESLTIKTMELIEQFNQIQKTASKVHVAILNIESAN